MSRDLLSALRAQPTATKILDHALSHDRVHHAYLFVGPDGVGKEVAAFGLAQALVCDRTGPAGAGGLFANHAVHKGPRGCGACSACVRALPRSDAPIPAHPDVIVIERGRYAPAQIGRRTPETQEISIDQIRTLVLSRTMFAPHEGRAKVFIVRRADELGVSAANALLKTLEEPLSRTHFVLLSSRPSSLLPTILSRTQRVRFAPLPTSELVEILVARGMAPDRAASVAPLAQGSVEAAEVLGDADEHASRTAFVDAAMHAIETDPTLSSALTLAEKAKDGKDQLRTHLAALLVQLSARAVASARAGHPDATRYAEQGRIVSAAQRHLSGNGAPQLVVEAMMARLRAAVP